VTDFDALPIDTLGLSTRPRWALHHNGIQTVGELMRKSSYDLMCLPNFGKISLAEVEAALSELGTSLAADPYARPPDLTIAPGAADLTFGSLLDTMIKQMFFDGTVYSGGGPNFQRKSLCCFVCSGTDHDRPKGARPSIDDVDHFHDCLLAKHLPRLRAMANKGVT